jgi:hypothetical protein
MTTSVDVVNLLVRGAGAVNPSGLERRICSAICSNGDNRTEQGSICSQRTTTMTMQEQVQFRHWLPFWA